MTVQRSRFQPPIKPQPVRPSIYRMFEPVAGINQARPPEHLKANEAWDLNNFTPEKQFLRVRSGATKIGNNAARFGNHTYFQVFDTLRDLETGAEFVVGFSNGSISASRATGVDASWRTLNTSSNTLSALSTAFYDTTQSYDADLDVNILVVTDGINVPGKVRIDDNGVLLTFAALATGTTWESNYADRPKFCAAFDDRVVLVSDETRTGILARWCDRGRPLYWANELGTITGSEALHDMKGRATGVGVDRERLYIFSNLEVWEATVRRDFNAFDFRRSDNAPGCGFPATVAETPIGVMYVTPDMRVYTISQGVARDVSEKVWNKLIAESAETWALKATYDAHEQAYALFYSTVAGAYANRCLKMNMDGAWYMHSSTSETWTGVGPVPLSSGTHQRGIIYGGSDGSTYAFHSQQSTDAGRNINATWDTPALNEDHRGFFMPTEAWVEHESDATSAITIAYSANKFSVTSATFGGSILNSTQTGSAFIPGTGQASRHPQFRLSMTNNVASKVGRVHFVLRPYSGRWPA